MIKLTELDPQFLQIEKPGHWRYVHSIDKAQGIKFLCPKCFQANGGKVGTHSVICWSRSRGVAESEPPGPGRWKMEGSGYVDLTLNADPPSSARSIALKGGCLWHGYVTNGDVS